VSVAQLQDVFKIGTLSSLRAAVEYRDDSQQTTPIGGARVFYRVLSGSGMWQWSIAPRVTLTNALRFDDLRLGRDGPVPAVYPFSDSDWNRSLNEVSFNSGLVVHLNDRDTFRLGAARGVLLPNLINFGGLVLITPQAGLTGSPSLRPTVVTSYEMGWTRSLTVIPARLRINVFHEDTAAVLRGTGELHQAGNFPYFLPGTVGNSHALGVEWALDGEFLESWRYGLNARWESVSDRFVTQAIRGTAVVDYEHVTPHGLFNASLGWVSGPWEIDGYLQYQSRTSGLIPQIHALQAGLTPIPAFVEADARIGYALNRHITLAICGQNLTQSAQRQTSGPEVERRAFVTVTAHF
jgi:iron complex outermembrane receptor protein